MLRSCGRRKSPDLARIASRVSGDDPAYIMFTSGTTGKPRGVRGLHRGLSHFLAWQREQFGVGPADRCAQLTGLSFDVMLRDVFLPLTSGAVLCLPGPGEAPAPDDTLAWLAGERATLLHVVPAVMRAWMRDVRVDSLRLVFFAGEPLPGELVEEFRARVSPSAEVVNLYGPTETTLAKAFYRVPAPAPPGAQPVGLPLPNTQIFVLNNAGQPCGAGELGEVVIRTPFRTAGYLDGTGFVANPFSADDRDVLFKTGDLGSCLPDGTLLLSGRLDDEIKIRGVRIAPLEVATALRAHPQVIDAVVLGQKTAGHGARLDGFVVLRPQATISSARLRADLQLSLPAVMVPSTLTIVPGFPVTANGKADRDALLAMVRVPEAKVDDQAERFSVIADLWSAVLEQKVSAEDDFFDLGGHSLHAATILSRIRKNLGLDLSIRTFFESPTLAEFVRAAGENAVSFDEPPLVSLDRELLRDRGDG